MGMYFSERAKYFEVILDRNLMEIERVRNSNMAFQTNERIFERLLP